MPDTATCPECSLAFPVTRYGHRVACPGCDEALDIQPDDPPSEGLSEVDWQRAIRGEIEWLAGAAAELREQPGVLEVLHRTEEKLKRLRALIGDEG